MNIYQIYEEVERITKSKICYKEIDGYFHLMFNENYELLAKYHGRKGQLIIMER